MPPRAAERSPARGPDGKSLSSEQADLALVLGHAGLQGGLTGDRGQGVPGDALREMLAEQAGARARMKLQVPIVSIGSYWPG